ncbi:YqaE/Pmp3 family membrane protein [Ascoidea rubescens DSM 1968]|uniref:UPF0057-domain-containing protein n=1 Tax=Ascoidea rubescens DSM 1968 TaxID=1344418 RepID=A0A1D2VFS7_9ASCO|nr:UPF0057-domain-containing protein [Ascoidea rubescens DSM 1968]ODV60511.1 UPF0057-domain-containing protein [Ascoidea rubescens DSM 1968]
MDSSKVISIVLAILLPPLSVYLQRDCGRDLLINVLLCCFVWFPGILHALYITFTN